MPFVTSVEKIGIEKGLEQGMATGRLEGVLAGIEGLLEVRFSPAGMQLLPEIQAIQNVEKLNRILVGLKTAASIEEARRFWA